MNVDPGLFALAQDVDGWADGDDGEWLSEGADDACSWMNENVAPEGFVFTFDEGFYLYAEDEDF
jgi:hypothetical protein